MPNRYTREAAIESDSVNSLSWQGEVFFRRLINRVDDFGRFSADPRLLRASIFPMQMDKVPEADVGKLLLECVQAGLVSVWQGQEYGKKYLALRQWERGRAKASKYPDPPPEVAAGLNGRDYIASGQHYSRDTGGNSDGETHPPPTREHPIPKREQLCSTPTPSPTTTPTTSDPTRASVPNANGAGPPKRTDAIRSRLGNGTDGLDGIAKAIASGVRTVGRQRPSEHQLGMLLQGPTFEAMPSKLRTRLPSAWLKTMGKTGWKGRDEKPVQDFLASFTEYANTAWRKELSAA